jgi:hypothetical protein
LQGLQLWQFLYSPFHQLIHPSKQHHIFMWVVRQYKSVVGEEIIVSTCAITPKNL